MGLWAMPGRARAVIAAGAAGLCLLMAGCTDGGGEHPRAPVLDLLQVEQSPHDELPAHSPAQLVVVPHSTRSIGSTGIYEFFLARGFSAPYCVVAIDIYDEPVGHACGGSVFGGELADGVRFEFGEMFARAVPRAESYATLNPYFTVAIEKPEGLTFPIVTEILSRVQRATDLPPGTEPGQGWLRPETYRVIGHSRGVSFFLARTEWVSPMLCVSAYGEREGGVVWTSASCGLRDVVLYTPGGVPVHFSAAGFEGETPEGWRQVSQVLRMKNTPPGN